MADTDLLDEGLPTRHKFDVDAYHRMGEIGVFKDGDRVELIEGELIAMAPIGSGHATAVNILARLLMAACAGRAVVSVQNPVRLDDSNEPQPDLALLKLPEEQYWTRHPAPDDVLLLIEVADTTLRFDRDTKLPLYARAGIAEVWIVGLKQRSVWVHRRPGGGAYADVAPCKHEDTVALALAPSIRIPLALLFPRPELLG